MTKAPLIAAVKELLRGMLKATAGDNAAMARIFISGDPPHAGRISISPVTRVYRSTF